MNVSQLKLKKKTFKTWVKDLFQILKFFRWEILRLQAASETGCLPTCLHNLWVMSPHPASQGPPHTVSLPPHPRSLLPPNPGKAVGLPEPLRTPATPTVGQPWEFYFSKMCLCQPLPRFTCLSKKAAPTVSSALMPLSKVYSPGSCHLCAPTSCVITLHLVSSELNKWKTYKWRRPCGYLLL